MGVRLIVVLAAASCGLLLAGFGAAILRAPADRISVRIRVTTHPATIQKVQSFSLTCNPTGGTLPFAARVCRDVSLHPKAMLAPPRRSPGGKSSVCSGSEFMPVLSVTATANGTTRRFTGTPGCSWPGDQAVSVYFDAAQNNKKDLPRSEALLRCDEDPVLFAVPTPLASVAACTHGLWTLRAEQLIQIAEKTQALAGLQPPRLFPHDIGALPCSIPTGGFVRGRKLSGLCGVTMKNVWSKATVSFTEDWPTGAGKTARHIWHAVGVGVSLREESSASLPVDGSRSEVSHSVPSGSPFGRPVQRCPKMMVQLTSLVTAGLVRPPTILRTERLHRPRQASPCWACLLPLRGRHNAGAP